MSRPRRSRSERRAEAGIAGGRTCVVCRAVRAASGLVRLTAQSGMVIASDASKGHGAYVCAERACLSGLTAGALARGLKAPLDAAWQVESFLADLQGLAHQRVLELVGLARRQGSLAIGLERVQGQRRESGDVIIVAGDVSERTQAAVLDARVFADADTLGHAAGVGRLGVLRIAPGPLARQAAYGLSLWYESTPLSGTAPGPRAGGNV